MAAVTGLVGLQKTLLLGCGVAPTRSGFRGMHVGASTHPTPLAPTRSGFRGMHVGASTHPTPGRPAAFYDAGGTPAGNGHPLNVNYCTVFARFVKRQEMATRGSRRCTMALRGCGADACARVNRW